MNPAIRDRRVTIERPVAASDEMGGRSKKWNTVCAAWEEFKKPRTQTGLVQGGVATVVTQEMTTPYNDDIVVGCRVNYAKRQFNVIGVGGSDRRYMTLICEEVVRHAG